MFAIWNQDTLVWVLQIVIVTFGIHLFLRFVRATRGNRLIRGVLVTVFGGYLGLYLLATAIGADALLYLLDASTGLLIVTLAIVFQSELRRAIAQLGERSFVGRLIQPAARDSLAQVTRAAQSMSSQRIGALIAFERETSLSSFIEEGTPVDADVNARLLESLFHPGTALHDGAVIISRDRVAAAGCFFPLPQDAELDASLGTRHRAAVGITEDTDCVVLVVSEETGHLSIAREGHIDSKIDPANLEDSLQRILQRRNTGRAARRKALRPRTPGHWVRDLTWLAASAVIALLALVQARDKISDTEERRISIVALAPSDLRAPGEGELIVVLPSDDYFVKAPQAAEQFRISVQGTRGALTSFSSSPAGTYELPFAQVEGIDGDAVAAADLSTLARTIDLTEVQWEDRVPGLDIKWIDPVELDLERIVTRAFPLTAAALPIADEALQSQLAVQQDGVRFETPNRTSVQLRGPESTLDELGTDPAEVFEPLDLAGSDSPDQRAPQLRLLSEVRSRNVTLEEGVIVLVSLQGSERSLDTVFAPVALISMDPARETEVAKWRLPAHAQEAQVRILSNGLIPQGAETDSPVWSEKIAEVVRYVESEVVAYVDISELDPDEDARSIQIHVRLRGEDWRDALAPILLEDGANGVESWPLDALRLHIAGDAEILLENVDDDQG